MTIERYADGECVEAVTLTPEDVPPGGGRALLEYLSRFGGRVSLAFLIQTYLFRERNGATQ